MENKPLLCIKDLKVVYDTEEGRVFAVNGLDLEIRKGERVGLVGETGAGKTTTALSIMRLLPEQVGRVTGGEITVEGKDLLACSEAEMRMIRGAIISMIFQDPMTSLNPITTVGDQILEVLRIHNYENRSNARLNEEVDTLFRTVGIPAERKHAYPHQFSGGMKQRILIAIAIACRPKLLVADEPTTALDVTIQAQILEMMSKINKELDTSMLLITHDLGIIARMCENVGIMYAGEIIEYGTMEQIFEDMLHPYTVGLFNSIPKLDDTKRRLNSIRGLMPDPTVVSKGCSFQPRCDRAMPRCSEEHPGWCEKDGHRVKCHLYGCEDISIRSSGE